MTLSIVPTRASDAHPTAPPARGCEASHTRRALLASAALAAPVLALPAVAVWGSSPVTAEPDPHPAWFAEWRALVDWFNGPAADPADDCPQQHRIIELEGLAAATPARTLAGATAQLRFARAFVAEYGSLGSGVNDEAMLDSALATLERLAGGARA